VKSLISASSTPASANTAWRWAWPCPPASRDLTVSVALWLAGSFSVTSTVPVNFINIAPIFTTISALTVSSLVRSTTRPPSTHGTTPRGP
jgi:hypothetical protein